MVENDRVEKLEAAIEKIRAGSVQAQANAAPIAARYRAHPAGSQGLSRGGTSKRK